MRKPFILLLLSFTLFSCSHQNPLHSQATNPGLPMANLQEGWARDRHEAKSDKFMVTTQGEGATRAGARMFAQGGNVMDAAAAISFAIAVERPQSTGLGGGGFLLFYSALNKKTYAIDFREKAPARAKKNMFLNAKGEPVAELSLEGALSSGVPGMVGGVIEAHAKFGRLKLADVLAPAIELAEKGFIVYPDLAQDLEEQKALLSRFPDSKKIFLNADGTPLKKGEVLVQKDLANTLRRIAKYGRADFYSGFTARAIVSSHRRHGGLIGIEDLKNYNVKWREPVWGEYKGLRIASMPPPSSGGIHVVEILNILEGLDLSQGAASPQSIHFTASAMQRAFADRAGFLGDSDFVKVPVGGLLSKEYASKVRAQIHASIAQPSSEVAAGNPWPFDFPYESKQTTHFTVMDQEGNAVASTQTINTEFGSGLVAEGTGVLLNNEMDDFSAKAGASNAFGAIGSDKNAIAPGKRPLSSMSPTIVFRGNSPVMALGTPSGTRIITCVAQTILNYFEHKMPLLESVASVRYHHQWSPDFIRVDPPGFPAHLEQKLRAMGHSIRTQSLGCQVNAIAREGSILHGVSDPRGEGLSIGE